MNDGLAPAPTTTITKFLTKQMATIVATGMVKQNKAAFLQVVKLPRRNTMNSPKVAAIPDIAVKIPRIDG